MVNNALKVVPGGLDVQSDSLLLNVWVTHNHHYVGRASKLINKGSELLVLNHH